MRSFLLGTLVLAAACTSNSTTETTQTTTAPAAPASPATTTPAAPGTTAPAAPQSPVPMAGVLSDVRTTHLFSNAQRPDQFRLVLRGDSALTATAHFSIVSAAGDTLWSKRFPATELLNYGINKYGENPTDAQKAHYIRKRAAEFFGDEAFSVRAELPNNNTPDKYTDRAAWAEIKDTGLPRFAYQLGEENGLVIAYSPKRRQAVMFYNCC